jgi:acetolactate synthase-1/2/3 large subunit
MLALRHSEPIRPVRVRNDQVASFVACVFKFTTCGEMGRVELQNPDFAAYGRACCGDGYHVYTLEEFEAAFAAAPSCGRRASSTLRSPAGLSRTTAPRRTA